MSARFERVEVKDKGGAEIHEIIIVDGFRISTFRKSPEEMANLVHNMIYLPIRDDDIMFCSPSKSGTHWLFEIMSMLLNGKPETIPHSKGKLMIEDVSQACLAELPSPRVLNSHLPIRLLPKQMKEKKTKIVLILRNPKDMCVSYYHHHRGIRLYNYDGKFENYVQLLLDGELDYGDWFDYILEMEEEIEKGEYDIHLVYYEDLKQNGTKEIKKLADFLGIQASVNFCQAIDEKCHIQNMIIDKKYDPKVADEIFRNGFTMYRKGEVGDWKNYFTVAMNEEFDKVYHERMKNSKLKFKFTLT